MNLLMEARRFSSAPDPVTYIVPLYPLVKGKTQRTSVTRVRRCVRPSSLTILYTERSEQWTMEMDNKKGGHMPSFIGVINEKIFFSFRYVLLRFEVLLPDQIG